MEILRDLINDLAFRQGELKAEHEIVLGVTYCKSFEQFSEEIRRHPYQSLLLDLIKKGMDPYQFSRGYGSAWARLAQKDAFAGSCRSTLFRKFDYDSAWCGAIEDMVKHGWRNDWVDKKYQTFLKHRYGASEDNLGDKIYDIL